MGRYEVIKNILNSNIVPGFISLLLNQLFYNIKDKNTTDIEYNFIWTKDEDPHIEWYKDKKEKNIIAKLYADKLDKQNFSITLNIISINYDITFPLQFNEYTNDLDIINIISDKIKYKLFNNNYYGRKRR